MDHQEGCNRILTVRIASKLFFTTAFTPTAAAAATPAAAMAKPEPKLEPWRNSKAKGHLEGLLRNQSSWTHIVLDTDAAHGNNINDTIKSIHVDKPLFTQYPLRNFTTKFKGLKKRIDTDREYSHFDQEAINKEKSKYPELQMSKAGYPRWNKSMAKKLLEEDIKLKRYIGVFPRNLRITRPEYLT
jgi:hypothetical protein